MASEARTDYSILMGLPFLLIVGPGPWSLDALRSRSPSAAPDVPL
jgi:putative oxidoreductase